MINVKDLFLNKCFCGTGFTEGEKQTIIDQTETNLIALRRTIYLTIQSALDFEECAHKLLRLELKPGQEVRKCLTTLNWMILLRHNIYLKTILKSMVQWADNFLYWFFFLKKSDVLMSFFRLSYATWFWIVVHSREHMRSFLGYLHR